MQLQTICIFDFIRGGANQRPCGWSIFTKKCFKLCFSLCKGEAKTRIFDLPDSSVPSLLLPKTDVDLK